MTFSQDTLRSALEQFRQSGDYTKLLDTLSGGKKEVNDLLLLQHALQTTDDPDLRDMLDDAAWARANNQPLPRRPSEESLNKIEKGATRAYGSLIAEVLPDLRDLAGAILTQTRTPPPLNAVIAAIGLHAQSEAETFRVSKDDFGQETRFYSTNCDACGGQAGGRGYDFVCPTCGPRARKGLLRERIMEQINRLPELERLRVDVDATVANNMTVESLNALSHEAVAAFIQRQPRLYGCAKCKKQPHKQPMHDCKCAKIVKIPAKCRDGQIVKGTRPADDQQFYAVLRVRE